MIDNSLSWIGVELDGVLAKFTTWKGVDIIGDPIKPFVSLVKEYIKSGVAVKIFTQRVTQEDSSEYIFRWLRSNGLPELDITNEIDSNMTMLYSCNAVQVVKNLGLIVTSDGNIAPKRISPKNLAEVSNNEEKNSSIGETIMSTENDKTEVAESTVSDATNECCCEHCGCNVNEQSAATFPCPTCGTKVLLSTKYCVKCKKKVTPPAATSQSDTDVNEQNAATFPCPTCGTKVLSSTKYCVKCKAKVTPPATSHVSEQTGDDPEDKCGKKKKPEDTPAKNESDEDNKCGGGKKKKPEEKNASDEDNKCGGGKKKFNFKPKK